ncbi:MAG: thiol oxidoreductase [Bacteroidetes bacterium]|nr:thiol oxidoreductase [Bacteroidota bacterium]
MKKLLRHSRKTMLLALMGGGLFLFSQCHKAQQFPEDEFDERLSGGAATIFDASSRAFTHPIPALAGHDRYVHDLGDAGFEQSFVAAPAPLHGGLGPIFNNVSCISCHHNDGKGIPTAGFANSSLLFRLSENGHDEFGGPMGLPGYGGQLQDQAVQGTLPEGKVSINYTEQRVQYPDGSSASLRVPTYTLTQAYAPMAAGFALSPRMAPPVFGLGLLELIPEQTLLSMADPNDVDGDGISGKVNYVWDAEHQRTAIGRFGLKANMPSILTQVAGAYNQDMGITNKIFPVESSFGQPQAPTPSAHTDLADTLLQAVAFYVKTLAVPARRDTRDPEVMHGQQLFAQIECGRCHQPTLQTGIDVRFPWLSNQRIHPYTDLLLHDMGSGLADNRPDFLANGNEWRTAPLWGIGLFEKVNGTPYYLHDGRARSLEEAILWHGGEAQHSKELFMQLSRSDRDAVLRFLKSL